MRALQSTLSFAREWHKGQWRARDVADFIGAEVKWIRGGPTVLGMAGARPSGGMIVLNQRVRATPLEWPVLLHEAAHIVQGHLLGFCGNAWAERQCERDATYGSAILAIPTESAISFVSRRATVHELADYYEVPRAMIYMRTALAVVLGEASGDVTKARHSLAVSRRSLDSWMAAVARGI